MATVTLKGNPISTIGNLPENGVMAPNFELTANDLSTKTLEDFKDRNLVLNVFPSIDTDTCAQSVRKFNQEAALVKNTKVLCISNDLPFAQTRFCAAEGIENVITLSDFKKRQFGENYGLTFINGPLEGLLSRAVIVINKNGKVIYSQQVSEIVDEPDYQAALKALLEA